ncbi:MAG: hypothetical protein AMXMBFR72_35750 [Betaproteobacteria bacterium]|nr:MAG: hypothetical protein BroJett031_30610 [Betaproteobacteria bacterium]
MRRTEQRAGKGLQGEGEDEDGHAGAGGAKSARSLPAHPLDARVERLTERSGVA